MIDILKQASYLLLVQVKKFKRCWKMLLLPVLYFFLTMAFASFIVSQEYKYGDIYLCMYNLFI